MGVMPQVNYSSIKAANLSPQLVAGWKRQLELDHLQNLHFNSSNKLEPQHVTHNTVLQGSALKGDETGAQTLAEEVSVCLVHTGQGKWAE